MPALLLAPALLAADDEETPFPPAPAATAAADDDNDDDDDEPFVWIWSWSMELESFRAALVEGEGLEETVDVRLKPGSCRGRGGSPLPANVYKGRHCYQLISEG